MDIDGIIEIAATRERVWSVAETLRRPSLSARKIYGRSPAVWTERTHESGQPFPRSTCDIGYVQLLAPCPGIRVAGPPGGGVQAQPPGTDQGNRVSLPARRSGCLTWTAPHSRETLCGAFSFSPSPFLST